MCGEIGINMCGHRLCGGYCQETSVTNKKQKYICIDYEEDKDTLLFADKQGEIHKLRPIAVKDIDIDVIGVKINKIDNDIKLQPKKVKNFYIENNEFKRPNDLMKHLKHMKELKDYKNNYGSYTEIKTIEDDNLER